MAAPRPLHEADLSRVEVIFTDVDGTLTTAHRLRASTVRALERLVGAGLKVVLVTGRPAGWAEAWARTLPVEGVVAENGGVSFLRQAEGRLHKLYAEPPGERERNRQRLVAAVEEVLREVPEARLSMDSAYTEVDLAIDYNEEARLGEAGAERLERLLRARGVTAVRSSVHVNCWLGAFDKRSAVERFLQEAWGWRLEREDGRLVYLGDSFNDAPMFGAFGLSVGVANVLRLLERLEPPPAFVTQAEEGHGFEELVRAVLAWRRGRRPLAGGQR